MKENTKTKILTDSEGLRISTIHTEDPDEEDEKTLNSAAREAYEAELRADAEGK